MAILFFSYGRHLGDEDDERDVVVDVVRGGGAADETVAQSLRFGRQGVEGSRRRRHELLGAAGRHGTRTGQPEAHHGKHGVRQRQPLRQDGLDLHRHPKPRYNLRSSNGFYGGTLRPHH